MLTAVPQETRFPLGMPSLTKRMEAESLGDCWESSSFTLKVNTSIINRSCGMLEKEKGLKECFSTHYRSLEIEELLELMEEVRIKENRM